MALDATHDDGEPVEVYFAGLLGGCGNLLVLPLAFSILWLPGVPLVLAVPAVMGAVYSLFLIIATLVQRKPMMVVRSDGVHLPIAGDVLLDYDQIEVWAEIPQLRGRREAPYWVFCLQGRPRIRLDVPWWAKLRSVRANTLLNGDLCFDERYISVDARRLASVIEARAIAR